MVSNFLLYDSEKKIAHQKHIEKKYKQSLYTTQTYIRKQVYTIQQFEDIIKKELLEKLEELNKDGKFPGLKSSNRFFLMGITLNSIVIDILLLYQRATSAANVVLKVLSLLKKEQKKVSHGT